MTYSNAMENRDIKRIDKLNKLKNPKTFWDDVRKFTKNITTDHTIHRWQCLAEQRFNEIMTGCEDVISKLEKYGEPFRYYNPKTMEEVFYKEELLSDQEEISMEKEEIIKIAMERIGTKRISDLDCMTLVIGNIFYNIYVNGNNIEIDII